MFTWVNFHNWIKVCIHNILHQFCSLGINEDMSSIFIYGNRLPEWLCKTSEKDVIIYHAWALSVVLKCSTDMAAPHSWGKKKQNHFRLWSINKKQQKWKFNPCCFIWEDIVQVAAHLFPVSARLKINPVFYFLQILWRLAQVVTWIVLKM